MAKALQCPDCGTRHPIDDVAHLKTFRCHECRRLLKVPAAVAADTGGSKGASAPAKERSKAAARPVTKPSARKAAAAAGAAGAAGKAAKTGTKTPPSKRPKESDAKTEMVGASENGGARKVPPSQRGTAIQDQTAKLRAVDAPAAAESRAPSTRVATRPRVARWIRVGAWVVAIPLGLIPVLIAGRLAGVLTMDHAVDVFVGVGWGRFIPPLVMLPVWSAATATVAHLIIESAGRARSGS